MPGTTDVRRIVMVCLALCLSLPAYGKGKAADDDATTQPEDAGRAFIERSLVLVPEQAGAFRLGKANDYPDRPDLGVGMRYVHPDFPAVRLDLFVYPIGRVGRDQALAHVLSGVREGVDAGVAQGVYANVVMGEETVLDLRGVAEDGSLLPEAGATPAVEPVDAVASSDTTARTDEHGPAADPQADATEPSLNDVLEAMGGDIDEKTDWRLGRQLAMHLDYHGEPQDSLAFAFYRGLYLYKGRISASPVDVPAESLQRLGRHAMTVLLPALQVRNAGSCSKQEIEIDARLEGDALTKQLAEGLFTTQALAEAENCEETLDETVPEGYRGLALEFDPAVWRKQP